MEKHSVESARLIPNDIEVINLAGNEIIEDIFRKCDLYYQKSNRDTFEKIFSHLLSELFYNITLFPHPLSETSTTLSPLISKALKYTNNNLCTVTGIEEIAEHLFVSESYLFRLFQKELHQTPKKYIMEKRLLLAQKMIRDGEKPTTVCERCGFGDYTTFYCNYITFLGIHHPRKRNIEKCYTEVTLPSGSYDRKVVQVQVLLPAPDRVRKHIAFGLFFLTGLNKYAEIT